MTSATGSPGTLNTSRKARTPVEPEGREVLRGVNRPGVQQAIPAGGVGGHRKDVSRRISQLDIRVLLHAEVATGGDLAIEGGREHAMLQRHPLRPAIDKYLEAGALPWGRDLGQLFQRQLDRRDNARCAEAEDLGGGVLVEAVDRIVGHHVTSRAGQLRHQAQMPAYDGRSERQPLVEGLPFLRAHDGGGAEAEGLAGGVQFLDQCLDPRRGRGGVAEEEVEGQLISSCARQLCGHHQWRRLRRSGAVGVRA